MLEERGQLLQRVQASVTEAEEAALRDAEAAAKLALTEDEKITTLRNEYQQAVLGQILPSRNEYRDAHIPPVPLEEVAAKGKGKK